MKLICRMNTRLSPLLKLNGRLNAEIVEFLKDNDVPVVTPAEMLEAESRGEFVDLVLDCAGPFAGLHPKIGFVELTRSGVQYYKDAEKPVYVADSGIVKRIETSLGTGDGYFRALEKLGFAKTVFDDSGNESGKNFEGRRLLVFGSGKVGSGIALQGVRRGCNVTVVTDLLRSNVQNSANPADSATSLTDKTPVASASVDSAMPDSEASEKMPAGDFSPILLQNGVEVVDCHDYEVVSSLIYASDFVVTATGVKNALAAPELQEPLLSTTAILANMGVEDEYRSYSGRTRAQRQGTVEFYPRRTDAPQVHRYVTCFACCTRRTPCARGGGGWLWPSLSARGT